MIIAGAGGHGLEVFQVLVSLGYSAKSIYFFDENISKKDTFVYPDQLIVTQVDLKYLFQKDPTFCLGVGSPQFRSYFYEKLGELGGIHLGVIAQTSVSASPNTLDADLMEFSFLGPEVNLGKGILINARANVHHECEVGDFTEIGPGAMILGGVKLGRKCRIGAGAVILPGIHLGDEVTVGAGAVVTKNWDEPVVLKGVPARKGYLST